MRAPKETKITVMKFIHSGVQEGRSGVRLEQGYLYSHELTKDSPSKQQHPVAPPLWLLLLLLLLLLLSLFALLLLLYVCVLVFFVFPTVALSFTYRPAARTSLCACPGRLPRLPSKRFTTLLPTAFAAHICNIVSANWAYDCVCVTLSVCVCVCVLLALNKTNTHTHSGTRRESWQKQQRMPHTFVFIMLNVSWGQQDHTHYTLTRTTTVTCAVYCLLLLPLLLLFQC